MEPSTSFASSSSVESAASSEPSPALPPPPHIQVQHILDRVYSPYTDASWTPRPFDGRSRRYLWSDAFGVCAYIALFDRTHNSIYLTQAEALVADVHATLGCYRDSTKRLEPATDAHPTLGGLRIGKADAQDDGQYYHYLIKWMYALHCLGRATQQPRYNQWAVELAQSVHPRFVLRGVGSGGGAVRMVWKMDVALRRVLVASEGNLDAFDGLVVYRLLQHASVDKRVLRREVAEVLRLVERKVEAFETSDALDAGEALWLAQWFPREQWAAHLQAVALRSLDKMFRRGMIGDALHLPTHRLMFREMGVVLGLRVALAHGTLDDSDEVETWRERADKLMAEWRDHLYLRDRDISPLMYAAALQPQVWTPPRAHRPSMDLPQP